MCTKHIFVLIHICNKGEVGTIKLVKPSSKNIFTDRSKAVLLLWISLVIYVSCLSVFPVCSFQPCGHLYVMFLVFLSLPMWCPGSGVVLDCIDS